MTKKDLFYKKITEEYDFYMEEVREMDGEDIADNAEYIADFINIYEYLMRDKPISEKSYLDHYIKMNKPLQAICEKYQETKAPIYDFVNPIIWEIGEKEMYDKGASAIKAEFMVRISENYISMNQCREDVYNKLYVEYEYLKNHIYLAADDDIKVLMQFENPLKLILESATEEMSDKIEKAADSVRSSDVFTMSYRLDHERILPETKFRHKAISDIANIVPKPDFGITIQWLEFLRGLNEECDPTTNPYHKFIDVIYDIAEEQGGEILQKLYEMGDGRCILENELSEAAKYLADGGDIEKVEALANGGYFDSAYEENNISDDDFLSSQTNMTMM